MSEKATYKATARRDGHWWYIQVPELGTSGQARSVGKIEEAARDIIGVWLDVEPDSFNVDVTIEIPVAAREAWEESKVRQAAARELEAAAAVLARTAVRNLRADGLSFKEAGTVLGLSPQRAHQLAADRHEKASA